MAPAAGQQQYLGLGCESPPYYDVSTTQSCVAEVNLSIIFAGGIRHKQQLRAERRYKLITKAGNVNSSQQSS